jgi:hypothetical protein
MPSVAATGRICTPLSPGDGAAVLVADFKALNGEPRLSKLICDVAVGRRIYQIDPRGAVSGDRLYASLPELADEAVASFRSCESPAPTPRADQRVFIVSHCSAVDLSLQIASRLADTHAVSAVLVRPTWPGTSENIAARFAEFQGKFGAGHRPCPDLDGDPWSCVAEMEQLMRAGLTAVAARLGLDAAPPAFAELLVTYRSWLSFLLACRNDQPARPPSAAVALSVLTDEPDFTLPATDPGRCRIVPTPPAEHPDAMTPELAQLVLDQVTSS